ncbi:addiction module RelE/StbE family toxin [Methanococcus maripaludis]|uniref:Addiction module RelE/StbE family toxin n=1 Tax=Methanococcus maripaludis TaxID=39152 RepID=A0A7J9NV58_METMI|nr:type II toxin-antitoxin system mRNA interferase toxin, RelE/StbE family [Methanococcus maripaludis]MBA2851558.1 addiction module RelE/StbE family toxin [Methanococcus maripaludis]
MVKIKYTDTVCKILLKIRKKDKKHYEMVKKQIAKIKANPEGFKPLKNVLKGVRRLHVNDSFVIEYKYDKKTDSVTITAYKHHDKAYK